MKELQIYSLIHSWRFLLLILIPLILFRQIIKRTAFKTKIQIIATFFLLILKTCLQKTNCLYILRDKDFWEKSKNLKLNQRFIINFKF